MSFSEFWSDLQTRLKPGDSIRNWTVKKGFLGDEFRIRAVSETFVKVDAPNAENFQHVPKKDFEVMYDNWEAYNSEQLTRGGLVQMTRFSKYTMSIIKHFKESKI